MGRPFRHALGMELVLPSNLNTDSLGTFSGEIVSPADAASSCRIKAFRLARRMRSRCPACSAPGWGWMDRISGLPCRWCGAPTPLTQFELHGCAACGHRQHHPRRDGMVTADPGQCPDCNP